MNEKLIDSDPELYSIIKDEFNRQKCSIELIASENYTSHSVMECLGSVLTNKYSNFPNFTHRAKIENLDAVLICSLDKVQKIFQIVDKLLRSTTT